VRAVAHARSAHHLGVERQGTGIVVEAPGLVLTSAALVQEADSILVTTADARTVHAAVALADDTGGFAILRCAAGLAVRPLPLGASARVPIPSWAAVAAAARGRTLAIATIVVRREFAGARELLIEDALLATPAIADAAGAALIDGEGRLIGVGALKAARVDEGAAPGAGNVFIPVERFQRALAALERGAEKPPARPWLGLVLSDDAPLAVAEVPAQSPAGRAGLQVGDVVTAVNGEAVATRAALYRRLWRERPGTEIVLTVRRQGVARELRLRAIDPRDYQIHRARLGTSPAGGRYRIPSAVRST
jgi:S1-C subfamily serine protease